MRHGVTSNATAPARDGSAHEARLDFQRIVTRRQVLQRQGAIHRRLLRAEIARDVPADPVTVPRELRTAVSPRLTAIVTTADEPSIPRQKSGAWICSVSDGAEGADERRLDRDEPLERTRRHGNLPRRAREAKRTIAPTCSWSRDGLMTSTGTWIDATRSSAWLATAMRSGQRLRRQLDRSR